MGHSVTTDTVWSNEEERGKYLRLNFTSDKGHSIEKLYLIFNLEGPRPNACCNCKPHMLGQYVKKL